MKKRLIRITALLALVCVGTPVMAQNEPRLRVGSLRHGPTVYRPGMWSTVQSEVVNPKGESIKLTVASHFNNDPKQLFARHVWMPPLSRRVLVQPVRLPEAGPEDYAQSISMTTSLLDESGFLKAELSNENSLLSVARPGPTIVLIGDRRNDAEVEAFARFEPMSHRGATSGGWSGQTESADWQSRLAFKGMAEAQAPHFVQGWEGVSCVIIAGSVPELDSLQIRTLRHWVVSGGQVWILLDIADWSFCRQLFGDAFTCEPIMSKASNFITISQRGEKDKLQRYRTPVPLLHVTAPGFDILHECNGQPASLIRSIGQGRLILTTLSARGWFDAGGRPGSALTTLGRDVIEFSMRRPIDEEDLEPLVPSPKLKVGAATRRTVVSSLTAMIVMALVCGTWLVRERRGEMLTLLLAALSVMTASGLIAAGRSQRQDKPAATILNVVQMAPDQGCARVLGAGAIFGARSYDVRAGSHAGGLMWPALNPRLHQARMLLWTDMDHWEWQLPRLPPRTLQQATWSQVIDVRDDASAALVIDADGVHGRVHTGNYDPLQSVSIHAVGGSFPVTLDESGQFKLEGTTESIPAAWPFQTNEREQTGWLPRRLMQMVRNYTRLSDGPVLLGWSGRSARTGMSFGLDADRNMATLVSIPLRIVPPRLGESFTVPSWLVEADVTDIVASGEHQRALLVRIPREVIPLKVSRMTMTVGSAVLDITDKAPSQIDQIEMAIGPVPGETGRATVSLTGTMIRREHGL